MSFRLVLLLVLLVPTFCVEAAAAAMERQANPLPAASTPVVIGDSARPMPAWVDFCATYPQECRVDPSEPETIMLTPVIWRMITTVNITVNRIVMPMTDMQHWGVPDRWNLAEDGIGDCEDFQLLKRKKLADAGLPRRAMPVTVVLDENGDGHAVLMIRTDRGDFILDNKRDAVLAWNSTEYIYVKREGDSATRWVSLNRSSGVTTTAARR